MQKEKIEKREKGRKPALALLLFIFVLTFVFALLSTLTFAVVTYENVSNVMHDYVWQENYIKLQVKSCNQTDCSDSNFSGVNANKDSYFTNKLEETELSKDYVPANRYFQYKLFFWTENNTQTSDLGNVTFDYTGNVSVKQPELTPAQPYLGDEVNCTSQAYSVLDSQLYLLILWYVNGVFHDSDSFAVNHSEEKSFALDTTALNDNDNITCKAIAQINSQTATKNITAQLLDNGAIYATVNDVMHDYIWEENYIKLQVRSCTQADCSDSEFIGDSEGQNYLKARINDMDNTKYLINSNRYFQYRLFFWTEDNTTTSVLENVTFNYTQTIEYSKFKSFSSTTYLDNINQSNTPVNLTLANDEYGEIKFLEEINLNSSYDLDLAVNISYNHIFVDSFAYPELNVSANITLYNLEFGQPKIYKDDSLCTDCYILSWNTNTGLLVFNVTGFSNYTVAEANQSKIYNHGPTNTSLYMLLKVEYYNKTQGLWVDDDVVYNSSFKHDIDDKGTIKLDSFFNGKWTVENNASYGSGTYRVFSIVLKNDSEPMLNYDSVLLNATYNFTVDMSAPHIVLNEPENDAYLSNSTVNLTWTMTDFNNDYALCDLYIDGVLNQTGINSTNATLDSYLIEDLSENIHNWSVGCTDNAGNYNSSVIREFVVDSIKPIVNSVSPENNTATANNNITLSFSANDNIKLKNCSVYTNHTGLWKTNKTYFDPTNSFVYETYILLDTNLSFIWNVVCYDYADNFNWAENRTVVYDSSLENTAPIIHSVNITPNNPKQYHNLSCFANLSDLEQNIVNLSFKWYINDTYNSTYNTSVICNLSNSEICYTDTNLTNVSYGWNYTCSARAFDESIYSDWVNSSTIIIGNTPPNVTLLYPSNGNYSLINRTPSLIWTASDLENDSLTFDVNVTCFPSCSDDNRYLSGLSVENVTLALVEYLYDGDGLEDHYYYNWSVRAYDGEDYSNWTQAWNFSVMSFLNIVLDPDTVDFGDAQTGDTLTTADDSFMPMIIYNMGNTIINVTFQAQEYLWESASYPSEYYQIKTGVNVTNSFNVTESITDFININVSDNLTLISHLNFNQIRRTARIDLNVTVPLYEAGGLKQANITFRAKSVAFNE